MIVYKDILLKLKEAGYDTLRLRKERLLSESVIQAIRENKTIKTSSINTICRLLNCQPGDILEYIDDDKYSEIDIK